MKWIERRDCGVISDPTDRLMISGFLTIDGPEPGQPDDQEVGMLKQRQRLLFVVLVFGVLSFLACSSSTPAPQTQEASSVVCEGPFPETDERIEPPKRISGQPPEIPAEARTAKVGGSVQLAATVDCQGKVTAVDVVSGMPHGMTDSVVKAVRTWRYEPATREGTPVAARHTVTVRLGRD